MRKQFQINLGQTGGEYFVTMPPSKDGPAFYFMSRTRQDAIDVACRGISNWLRLSAKTAPKSKFSVDKVEKYVVPTNAQGQRPKTKKFGGIPIKQVVPNETITVSVEV